MSIGQRTEGRWQKTEVRRQMAEDRRQRADGRKQITEIRRRKQRLEGGVAEMLGGWEARKLRSYDPSGNIFCRTKLYVCIKKELGSDHGERLTIKDLC